MIRRCSKKTKKRRMHSQRRKKKAMSIVFPTRYTYRSRITCCVQHDGDDDGRLVVGKRRREFGCSTMDDLVALAEREAERDVMSRKIRFASSLWSHDVVSPTGVPGIHSEGSIYSRDPMHAYALSFPSGGNETREGHGKGMAPPFRERSFAGGHDLFGNPSSLGGAGCLSIPSAFQTQHAHFTTTSVRLCC